jgi:hypothetical protein
MKGGCFERHNAHSYGHFVFLKLGASIWNIHYLFLIFYQKNGADWKSSWVENVVYVHSKYKHILGNSKTNKHSNVGCK